MTTATPQQGTVVGALTEGTGVSSINITKLVKDFVADFLISAAAALTAVQVASLQDVATAPNVALFAVAGAAIHAAYRIVLRWATTT